MGAHTSGICRYAMCLLIAHHQSTCAEARWIGTILRRLTDTDRALLVTLVFTAQPLALDAPALRAWMEQLSDHERALLVTWVAHQGLGWNTATVDLSEDTRPS